MPPAKRRGLSLEEKREKLLEIFYESKDFYLLKEIERLGPRKGVISQSVKDVLQSLVDDDLVCRDKIGTSVYFWALPSTAGNKLQQASAQLDREVQDLRARESSLQSKLEAARKGRESTGARDQALAQLTALEEENKRLQSELDEHTDNDPEVYERKVKAVKVAHEAVNRWTENVFSLQQWCNDRFPEAAESLNGLYKEVGITDDLDYVM